MKVVIVARDCTIVLDIGGEHPGWRFGNPSTTGRLDFTR
jgi:hypothetical protein